MNPGVMNEITAFRKGHRELRRGRSSLTGQIYLVTFTTYGRRRLFANADLAITASRSIVDQRLWQSSQLLAWVLMPDHWHGLIQLEDGASLSAIVQRLKANSARSVRAFHTEVSRVWAAAFHDHGLRREEEIWWMLHAISY